MGLLALLIHLLNFVAPAVVVGALLAVVAPWVLGGVRVRHGWARQALFNALAGSVALVLGLWFFGNDGKMASYCAMLLMIGTCQWLFSRAGKKG